MYIAETERLILRHFTHDDVADMAKVMGDPEVMKFSLKGPLSFKETEEFIQYVIDTYEQKGFGLWAVEYKQTGEVIGYCGYYFPTIDGVEEIEMGYRLASSCWGQGLATEAAKAVLRHAFGTLQLSHLVSIIEAENIASIRVAEKCGLKYEKDCDYHGIPVRIYSIEAQEYILLTECPNTHE